MQDLLAEIYNACDPFRPATGEQYVDLDEVRGSGALLREVRNHLDRADDYLTFLFTGHLGCGKTSELVHLNRELERPSPIGDRYFVVHINYDDYCPCDGTKTLAFRRILQVLHCSAMMSGHGTLPHRAA